MASSRPVDSPHLPRLAALALLLATASACHHDATAPLTTPPEQPPATSFAPALVEVTISGIGSPQMTASVSAPAVAVHSSSNGISYSLSGPLSAGGSGDGSIELEPFTTGSFTDGVRTPGSYRYVWATFRVRNAQKDGTAYDTPRTNLTFFAATTAGTIGGSAIASMERFDGSPAIRSVATEILPTGSVYQQDGQTLSNRPDVLQVISEGEAAAVVAPVGVGVLPYGFVVRGTNGGRTLPASPAAGQYDGVVTFAFKIPLQASAAEDPFTVTALFLAEDDSETRLTQSLEEQTTTGEAAFLARAQAIGATMKTVLPGAGTYRGDPIGTRTICSVRTAGPTGSPAAYLINRVVASVTVSHPLPDWPLWAGGSVARDLGVVAVDGSGTPVTDVSVQMNFGTPGVLTVRGSEGSVRMLPRRDRASTTVSASACGTTSAPFTLRTSGFSPIAAGESHSLALKSDGTVVARGKNDQHQTDVPVGLTGVVQVAAGGLHSLALKSDGTVQGWGYDGEGEATVPVGLTDVVQIAASVANSLALKSDGTVVGWGINTYGQRTVPQGLTGVVQIAAGANHALALKSDGTVVGWGRSDEGQITVPTNLTGVVQIAAGYSHSLALKSDGTVVGWGYGGDGQIAVPTNLTDVVQIAAGYSYSLALKSDGTVVGWGANEYGQRSVPQGLTGVVQIAAGADHALALKSDGTVVGWGRSDDGRRDFAGLVVALP